MPEGLGDNYWTRRNLAGGRWSRRSVLRGTALAVGGLAGAALIGCGEDGGDDEPSEGAVAPGTPTPGSEQATATAQPEFADATYGGILLYDQGDEPVTLDNHIEEPPGSVFAANLAYEQLVQRWEDYEQEPGRVFESPRLAAEWTQEDEQTVVFKLQPNVKWHNLPPVNGRAMTSEDVKYSIERMIGDDPRLRTRSSLEAIESVETPDELTVVVKTAEPYASLIPNIGHTWAVIVPPELAETPEIEQRSVGTGPFIFENWQRGVELNWTRNPDYWKPGQPFLDGFRMRIQPDATTRLANFRAGELMTWGGSYSSTPKETIDSVIESVEDVRVIEYDASGSVTKVAFDTTGDPFSDKRLREAFKYGLAYDRVIELFGGLARQTSMFSPLNLEWGPPDDMLPQQDPQRAAKLLAAAGYGPDNPLKVKTEVSQFYSGPTVSQIVQQLMKPLGVDLEISIMENARWIAEVYRGSRPWQVSSHGDWAWEDADRGLFSYYHSTGSANATHYSNPDVDALLEKQRSEFDAEARREIVLEAVEKIIDDTPQAWIVTTGGVTLVRNELKNYKYMIHGNSNSYRQFADVWLDG